MSFSAQWGKVDPENLDHDLSLEVATVSPPLEGMADDVKEAVAGVVRGAARALENLPTATGAYRVAAYGHVRQGDQDTSTVTITINEYVAETSSGGE